MNPAYIVAIAILGFLGGRATARRPREEAEDEHRPKIPPIDPPKPLPEGGVGFDFTEDWLEYDGPDVEIYPEGVPRSKVPPPPSPLHVGLAPGCAAVSVPVSWWDVMLKSAAGWKHLSKTHDLMIAALERWAPECIGAGTEAAINFKAELFDRLKHAFPGSVGEPPGLTVTELGPVHVNPRGGSTITQQYVKMARRSRIARFLPPQLRRYV